MTKLVSERPIQLPEAVAGCSGGDIRAVLLQPSAAVLAVSIILQADRSQPEETTCECCVWAKGAQYAGAD